MSTQKIPYRKVVALSADKIAKMKDMRAFDHITRLDRMVNVRFDKIRVRDGFNRRTDFGDIEQLAAQIEAQGLRNPLLVDILTDGTPLLKSGERRYRAIMILRNKDNGAIKERFHTIPCIINDRDMTEADRIITEISSNAGKPFTALEESESYKALRDDHKMKPIEIARATGHSVSFVEAYLLLADESPAMKEALKKGAITPTAVIKLNRTEKNPVLRASIVAQAVATGGKIKVKEAAPTKKDAPISKEELRTVKKTDLQDILDMAKQERNGDIGDNAFRTKVITFVTAALEGVL